MDDDLNKELDEVVESFIQKKPSYQEAKFIVEQTVDYIVKFELQDIFSKTIKAIEEAFPSEVDLLKKITNHREISKIVDDIKEILSVSIDDLKNGKINLGHYTNINVLPKLISTPMSPTGETNSSDPFLRLTNSRQLNDPMEGKILFKYLQYDEVQKEEFVHSNVYLASTSTSLDNLPMWKQYGDNAEGACLVYKHDFLADLLKSYDSSISIFKIFYLKSNTTELEELDQNSAEETEIINKLIMLRNYIKDNGSDSYALEVLERLALYFKSDEYSYENEYRIMQDTGKMDEEEYHLTLEKNKTFDFPFLYLYLEKTKLDYSEVIFGPKSIDIDYIGPYLKHCEPEITITKSKISYR